MVTRKTTSSATAHSIRAALTSVYLRWPEATLCWAQMHPRSQNVGAKFLLVDLHIMLRQAFFADIRGINWRDDTREWSVFHKRHALRLAGLLESSSIFLVRCPSA
jgi:hypothetical protein